jgi:hypothetical protein
MRIPIGRIDYGMDRNFQGIKLGEECGPKYPLKRQLFFWIAENHSSLDLSNSSDNYSTQVNCINRF